MLVGRCPAGGHEILRGDDKVTEFTCLCPGRADGLYALAFGAIPSRRPESEGSAGQREHIGETVVLVPKTTDVIPVIGAAETTS